jgi:glycosyltransferase involved in cell wall biosynthesis
LKVQRKIQNRSLFSNGSSDEERLWSIQDLLAFEGEEFIVRTYRALLRREPDPQGLNYYTACLGQGIPKMELLRQIGGSAEARKLNVQVPGFRKAVLAHRFRTMSGVGSRPKAPAFTSVASSIATSNAPSPTAPAVSGANDELLEAIFAELTSVRALVEKARMPGAVQVERTEIAVNKQQPIDAFFTICAKNFLAHARVLYKSVRALYPDTPFFVVLCDGAQAEGFDPTKEPFDFVYLEQLKLPDVGGMSQRYNITEFNTSVKPFSFEYLFDEYGFGSVVYLDPDLFFVDRMTELEQLLVDGAEAVLTPHLLEPAEHDEVHDGKMLLFGIYNLGFLALRNTPSSRKFLAWWGRRLEHDCTIRLEQGIFVDQKWADLLPAYVPGTEVLHHAGYNVAYWNLPQRQISRKDGKWFANDEPLRFVHFSGNKLDDPSVFSRHSQQVTIENIGPLRELLDAYRAHVWSEGHNYYRRLPYSFSWNGVAGVNLHTPETLDQARQVAADVNPQSQVDASKRLLYIDWAIPMPDRDAASVTAMLLLRIFVNLGYAVTFLPAGLKYEAGYYEALVAEGVEVILDTQTPSSHDWVRHHAHEYEICFLCRGPVAWPFLEILNECAPQVKRIFNTVDLHYLREMREAEISGAEGKKAEAARTKEQELDLIRRSHVSILLSNEELYAVRKEIEDARLAVLPIVFQDIPGAVNLWGNRRDILFVGSYPHKPNIDAALYFAKNIFPLIQQRMPSVKFKVVGANPPPEITILAQENPGIEVMGFVEDLGALLEQVKATVAPLRYGAGIKGKIGSSLCHGVPCVATSIAVEGMGLTDGENVLVADAPEHFANAILRLYTDRALWNTLSEAGTSFAKNNYSQDVITARMRAILWTLTNQWEGVESLFEIESWRAWNTHSARMQGVYQDRVLREQKLLPDDRDAGFRTSGFCCICGKATQFLTSFMYSTGPAPDGRPMPNWREHMQCEHCGLVNRMRAALHVLHTVVPPVASSRIYITEATTGTYQWMKARYPELVGSEYFGPDHAPGSTVNGTRHEDVMGLSFPDSSFDLALSFDVLEHVPYPDAAFRQLFRILRPGGALLFSVPFATDRYDSIIRASIGADGELVHHMEPEFHGNPVDPEGGALCFQYFGWKMLDDLRRVGFSKVRALAYWSQRQGYLGGDQYLFLAQKQ